MKYCTNDSQLCYANANAQADTEYKRYVKQQKIEGRLIDYDQDSFLDPLQCAKLSCDCEADYRACYKMCGGFVQVNKRCVANCK